MCIEHCICNNPCCLTNQFSAHGLSKPSDEFTSIPRRNRQFTKRLSIHNRRFGSFANATVWIKPNIAPNVVDSNAIPCARDSPPSRRIATYKYTAFISIHSYQCSWINIRCIAVKHNISKTTAIGKRVISNIRHTIRNRHARQPTTPRKCIVPDVRHTV